LLPKDLIAGIGGGVVAKKKHERHDGAQAIVGFAASKKRHPHAKIVLERDK
jgi:hypothetical protein